MEKKIETFLRCRAPALAVVGPSGCGKLYATERAAQSVGLRVQIVDRSQGSPNYARWGCNSLSPSGALDQPLYVLVCADQETDFSGMLSVLQNTPGLKVVLLANEVSDAMRNAKIPVERVGPPTAVAMTKILFLEHDWDVAKAQRLSRLASGDWRRLHALDRFFTGAGVDVATMSDEAFGQTLERMARDPQHQIHPTLAVHQLFSGLAEKQGRTPEDLVDASVFAWGERSHGILCDSVDAAAAMQEAAVYCDVLTNAGQPQLGLQHWARAASVHGALGLRYDYASYANPWTPNGKEAPADAAARASWLQRTKQRLSRAQNREELAPACGPKRKAAAKKAGAKRVAKGKSRAARSTAGGGLRGTP